MVNGWLVGGFKYGWMYLSISYMGCHPKPIDELFIFFKMVIAPPSSLKCLHVSMVFTRCGMSLTPGTKTILGSLWLTQRLSRGLRTYQGSLATETSLGILGEHQPISIRGL